LAHQALDGAKTIVNVGAGAGSYEPAGAWVLAVEPSESMRAQRPKDRPAINGFADHLPLDDDSVDAAMAMITVHQWPDAAKGLAELRRVARGPVVVLTFDGAALDRWWLADYAPELFAEERKRYPPIADIAAAVGARAEVIPVLIPLDCVDGFTEAFYGRPEKFLDPAVRGAQSAWGFVDPAAIARFETALSADLASGKWDERYGHLRTQPTFEGSVRLIVGWPA
jgi:SAM-dependent methyltransferase